MKRIFPSVLLALPLIFAFQCGKDDDVYCTMEFRSITLEIQDPMGMTLVPDSFFVVDVAQRDTVRTHLSEDYGFEGIVVFSDAEMNLTNTDAQGKLFRLTAYSGQQLILTEDYRIRHDRCHIELVSGPTAIQL